MAGVADRVSDLLTDKYLALDWAESLFTGEEVVESELATFIFGLSYHV